MPLVMNGSFEIVDFRKNCSVLFYDNVEYEEYPLHWHNSIEIIMPMEGEFHVVCDGEEYCLLEQEMLIIPAGTLHNLKARKGRRYIFLIDADTIMNNPALRCLSGILNKPLHIRKESPLLSQFGSIMHEIGNAYANFGAATETFIYIKVITMLYDILSSRLQSDEADGVEGCAEAMAAAIRYIDINYTSPISLDTLAKVSGYSKFYFSKMFSRYTQSTLPDYLNRRRIMAAELLLMNDALSVTDIAMQSGFSSITTFNRVFRKLKGCSPSEFKQLKNAGRMH